MGKLLSNLGKVSGDVLKKDNPASATHGSVFDKVQYKSMYADQIEKKFKELGGERHFGTLIKRGSQTWYYQWGCLYYNQNLKTVFEIYGAIYVKWQALGGLKWGLPTTDELPCADGVGRFSHFIQKSGMLLSIFWSPQTGANGIWGEIRKRWTELGYERSYLGYPTTDEIDFPENGRVNGFQNGDIYYWHDTGPIDLKNVRIFYSGLYCVQESVEDQSSNSDEPYVVIGVSAPNNVTTFTTPIYSDVDTNESNLAWMEIYNGKPYGLSLSTVVMENDFGDPNKFRDVLQTILKTNHEIGTAALGVIPLVGPFIAAVVGSVLGELMPKIGDAINNALGTEDDLVGSSTKILTARELVMLTRDSIKIEHLIPHKFYMNAATLINGRTPAGSYRIYFQLFPG